MSFLSKWEKGKEYPYFRAGAEGQYSLGPTEKPNVQNILKSLDYVNRKNLHYSDVENKLVSMLPENARDNYISKRLKELNKSLDKELLSYLSEDGQKEYLQMRIADLQTKLRKIEKKFSKAEEITIDGFVTSKKYTEAMIEFLKRPIMAEEILQIQNDMRIKSPKEAESWSLLHAVGDDAFNEFLDLIWTWFLEEYSEGKNLIVSLMDLVNLTRKLKRPIYKMMIEHFLEILESQNYLTILKDSDNPRKIQYRFTEKGIKSFVQVLIASKTKTNHKTVSK